MLVATFGPYVESFLCHSTFHTTVRLSVYLLGRTFCKFIFSRNNLKTKYESGSKITSYSAVRDSFRSIYSFIHLATVPSGPGPLYHRGFTTTRGRTSLDE